MAKSWIFLLLAGLFEIGWPVGMKLAQNPAYRILGIAVSAIAIGLSGWFMWLAQKHIPMGTVYAVWTGIGAAGAFIVGITFFGDAFTLGRALGVALIVAGVVTIKLAS